MFADQSKIQEQSENREVKASGHKRKNKEEEKDQHKKKKLVLLCFILNHFMKDLLNTTLKCHSNLLILLLLNHN